jgi:multiple antibiotic resistance protein
MRFWQVASAIRSFHADEGTSGRRGDCMVMEFRFAATAFATAFTIIDPVGMIPFALAVTAGSTPRQRSAIVDRAVIIAAVIILVMGLAGRALLEYLGITLSAFTIAGGALLFLIAIDMLFARPSGTKQTDAEEREATQIENPAVFPLAVPMIAGPGTIATVLLLVNMTHYDGARLAIVFAAFVAALFVTWVCMRGATLVLRVIGKTGVHVVTRLLGIILAALAVQFVLNGLTESPLFRHPA